MASVTQFLWEIKNFNKLFFYGRISTARYLHRKLCHWILLLLIFQIKVSLLTRHDSWTNSEKINTGSSSAMSHERNISPIAAKKGNVLLHPVKSSQLIHKPVIRDLRFRMRWNVGVEEAENSEPVVDRYDYLVSVTREDAPVVWISASPVVALPVDVQKYRMPLPAVWHSWNKSKTKILNFAVGGLSYFWFVYAFSPFSFSLYLYNSKFFTRLRYRLDAIDVLPLVVNFKFTQKGTKRLHE